MSLKVTGGHRRLSQYFSLEDEVRKVPKTVEVGSRYRKESHERHRLKETREFQYTSRVSIDRTRI